ncbi:ArsR/SmtB family transcription factor [Labedaea rhizosphaerae]|uniref:ArsR/SmtB family transcription factor n=1 Tax=Labedaea rhizosphaerae TaxID=598644 RepID=UPI00105B44DF|nr:metalloregulator ArsR/SmtB family transcription factor [Labedaea rhizosphaerae]
MPVSAALVLDALGDQSRRAILEHLVRGPKPVGELAKVLPISRPAVSQHLKVLKDAQLVSAETIGTRHLYRVNRAGLDALRDYLDRFWRTALANFAAIAEAEAAAQKGAKRAR